MTTLPPTPEAPDPPEADAGTPSGDRAAEAAGPRGGEGSSVRPVAVGAAAILAWLLGALAARRILGIYPLPAAKMTLYYGWIVVGGAAWALAARAHRSAAWGAVLTAAFVPVLLVAMVPGIRRPTTYPIPGGGAYALSASPHGNADVYLIRGGDGSHPTQLTDTPWSDLYPALSPERTQIAYSSGQGRSVLELRLMTIDASGKVTDDRTLVHASVDAIDAHWSHDGSSVFFIEAVDGLDTLMRTDLEGHVTTVVRSVSNPAPSPDGTHIALSWSGGIWVATTQGTDPQEIIRTGGIDSGPVWSPDGTRIVFTQRSGSDENVYLANADGTGVQDLTPNTDGSTEYAFGWTPDGHVLFLSNRLNTGGTFIYSMNADGSDVRLVTII